jgi:hypothetical protein
MRCVTPLRGSCHAVPGRGRSPHPTSNVRTHRHDAPAQHHGRSGNSRHDVDVAEVIAPTLGTVGTRRPDLGTAPIGGVGPGRYPKAELPIGRHPNGVLLPAVGFEGDGPRNRPIRAEARLLEESGHLAEMLRCRPARCRRAAAQNQPCDGKDPAPPAKVHRRDRSCRWSTVIKIRASVKAAPRTESPPRRSA